MGHAPMDGDTEVGDLGEAHRIVRLAQDGLGQVEADLAGIDVEGGGELDVAHVIAVHPRPHEARDEPVIGRVPVILDALDSADAQLPTPTIATRTAPTQRLLSLSRVAGTVQRPTALGGDATPKV